MKNVLTSRKATWSVTDVRNRDIIICPNDNKPNTNDYKTACDESLIAQAVDEDGNIGPAEAKNILKVHPSANGFPEYIGLNVPVDMKWLGGPRTELKADLIIIDLRFNSFLFYCGGHNVACRYIFLQSLK